MRQPRPSEDGGREAKLATVAQVEKEEPEKKETKHQETDSGTVAEAEKEEPEEGKRRETDTVAAAEAEQEEPEEDEKDGENDTATAVEAEPEEPEEDEKHGENDTVTAVEAEQEEPEEDERHGENDTVTAIEAEQEEPEEDEKHGERHTVTEAEAEKEEPEEEEEEEKHGGIESGAVDEAEKEEPEKEKKHGRTETITAAKAEKGEPEKKKQYRDASQGPSDQTIGPISKIPPTSGFANTSAISPFATRATGDSVFKTGAAAGEGAGSSSGRPQSSVFASSGFGALAGSTTSPFATVGQSSTGSVFGGGLGAKPGSVFGSGIGKSLGNPFLAKPAAGGLGTSTFGSVGGLSGAESGAIGGGISTFGSKGGFGTLGSKPTIKPFGAPESDDEGEQAEGEEGPAFGTEDPEEHKDERFHEQDSKKQPILHGHGERGLGSVSPANIGSGPVETGEEGEETRFAARAKLFHFDTAAKAWKERGAGLLKLNVSKVASEKDERKLKRPRPEDDDTVTTEEDERKPKRLRSEEDAPPEAEKDEPKEKRLARLLMRAEAVYRVMLNVPVFKTLKAGDQNGKIPTDRYFKFTALEDNHPVIMQLRFGNIAAAKELWECIKEVQEEL